MQLSPLTFDSNAIGPTTDYGGRFEQRHPLRRSSQVTFTARRNAGPMFDGITVDGERLVLTLSRRANAATARATWHSNVKKWFDPASNRRGARFLTLTGDDGSTTLRLPVYVAEVLPRPQDVDAYDITLLSGLPYFEANSEDTSGSNPSSVTNAGNVAAAPVLQLTSSTHVTRRQCTVRGSGAGGGLNRRVVMLDINDSAMTSSNVIAYVEGVSVPCAVSGGGTSSSKLYVLIDTHSDGATTTHIDVVYGTGVTNPLAGALDVTPWHTAAFSNSEWRWSNWNVSAFRESPGVWRPTIRGNHLYSSTRYGLTADGSGSLTIGISAGTSGADYPMDADSVMALLAGLANGSLANFSRQITGNSGGYNQAYVRYRTTGGRWVDAWTSTTAATVTTSITITNATAIQAGIRSNNADNAVTAALVITNASSYASVALTSGSQPTIVVGSAETMDLYSGTLTIGDDSITLANVMVPDGTLTIDCHNRTIRSSVSGAPIYGAFAFSAPATWALLQPGSNAVSHDLSGGSLVVKHRGAYS